MVCCRWAITGMVVSRLELRERKETLKDAGEVAAVSNIFQTREALPEQGLQLPAVFCSHGEIPLEILLHLHLHQALLCLLPLCDVDTPMGEMLGEP